MRQTYNYEIERELNVQLSNISSTPAETTGEMVVELVQELVGSAYQPVLYIFPALVSTQYSPETCSSWLFLGWRIVILLGH